MVTRIQRIKAGAYIRANWAEHVDARTNELNLTFLEEAVCDFLGLVVDVTPDWISDMVFTWYERLFKEGKVD